MNSLDYYLDFPAGDTVLSPLGNQVADPLSFLRELVQNAIDAGSVKVDVSCIFEDDLPATANRLDEVSGLDRGTAVIRVADCGHGMNRNIIDTHLTRLFSSEKEGDPSKIGKFGIGFSSVFALKPDAVCVDTGRYGEHWRVVFRPDRSFTRVRLHESVEGTTVRLWKALSRSEFEILERGVRRALHHHCPHVEVALRYQGESLGSPLDLAALEAPIKAAVFEQEASIVVGFTNDGAADLASFYNRGLTLLVRPSELPGISYKVNSPRLAPTLGRDHVLPDEHYHQILSIVRRLASGPLLDELSQRLDQSLRRAREEEEVQGLQRRLAQLLRLGISLPASCSQRLAACSPHGHLYTLLSCQQAAGQDRLFAVAHPSPLSAAVCKNGEIVLEDWQRELLTSLCHGEPPRLERVLVLPLPMKAPEEIRGTVGEALRTATLSLLKAAGAPVSGVEIGYLDYPGSGASALLAVVQAQPFTISKLAGVLPRDQKWTNRWEKRSAKRSERSRSTWVLNADHLTLKALLPLSVREPELAAYSLIKLCLHGGPLTPGLDSDLLALAMVRRCQRQEAPLTERLIASLTAAGVIDSPGAFTINPEMAREKIRRSRSPNPLRYVLDLVQAASLKGATHISFKFSAGNMQMHFDGEPFAPGEFEELYASLLHNEGGPDAEARRRLATGLCTALQVDPALIQIESGQAFVELRPGHPDRHAVFEQPARLTHIRIDQRLGLGLIKRYVDHLGGHLTEELLLQERCVHARIAIKLDGRLISQGHALSDVTPWRTFTAAEIAGAVGVAPLPAKKPTDRGVETAPETALSPTLLRLVQNGVWVDTQLPIELSPGFRALAESAGFQLDIAGEHVVQGPKYAAALRAVAAAQVELLSTLCRRYIADSEGELEDVAGAALPAQHLRALLRGMLFRLGGLGPILRWAQIPLSHFPPDTIAEGNPGWPTEITDGAALLAVPIFPSTTGELVSLSQLLSDFIEHKTVAYSAYHSREADHERALVLHVAEPGSEALLRTLFGDALECRDAAAKQAWAREHSLTAWRRRAYRPRLSNQVLLVRAPFTGPGITGEIGIEPRKIPRAPWKRRLNQPCTLRLLFIKDGCLLVEKTVPFPVPDMTVAVTGDFSPSYLFENAPSDSQLAIILESLWNALPLLIEQLVHIAGQHPPSEGGAALLTRDDETLAWWACVLRRLLMLALSAEARQSARIAMGIRGPDPSDFVTGELHPHPLWIQLRDLPLFEALDGTPLRPSDLEAAAVRCGYVALLCPTHPLHPKRLESWASLCHADVAPTELWTEAHTESASSVEILAPSSEPPPFILWLAPCERALREQLCQQLPPTHIVDAELWLRAATARAAAHSQHHAALSLPEECEFHVPLTGVEGMLGVVNESGFLALREQEPRLEVALLKKRHLLGKQELWLPGGQFLSAVADHPQLELTADQLDIADDDAMVAVRSALAGALPDLLALLIHRPLPWSPLSRLLLFDVVTALFPRPAFRRAYERLRLCERTSQETTRGSADAELYYDALLQLAVATSRDRVEAVLEHHLVQAGPLSLRRVIWDVIHFETTSWMSVFPEQEAAELVQAPLAPPGAMAWLDVLYPDSEGLPMDERCLHLLPALAAAPLLQTSDGSPLHLAEVISDFKRHGYILCSASRAAATGSLSQRPVILDSGASLTRMLHCLFGPDNVREEPDSPRRNTPPQQPVLNIEAASRNVDSPSPSASAQGDGGNDLLLAAAVQELRATTLLKQPLFEEGNQAWLQIADIESSSAVIFEGQQCIINRRHPAMQLVQRRFAKDPQCVRFLASAIFTALTAHLGLVNDAEAAHFHHHLAVRALSSTNGGSAGP